MGVQIFGKISVASTQKKKGFSCSMHVCTYCVLLQSLGMMAAKLTELYALNFLLLPIN